MRNMALEQELDERLKQALKAKDTRTADVLRMLKKIGRASCRERV